MPELNPIADIDAADVNGDGSIDVLLGNAAAPDIVFTQSNSILVETMDTVPSVVSTDIL
ncbi:MAG: hypothetical protein ACJAUP_001414 [Cellvibrionaceae bacterium]